MKSRRWSITPLNDWRLARNRYACFTFANLSADWLAGEWITGEVTLLGLGVTLTRWSRKPVVSGFPPELLAEALTTGSAFQFYPDNWPEGVPVESLGRNFTADQLAQYIADEEGKEHAP